MKTKILFFVLLMIVNLSYGQTQTTTYITFGGLIADCNSIKKYGNNQGEHKWKVSHGSPNVVQSGSNKDCRFIAKINANQIRLTEGAFVNFDFKKDHTYEFKITFKRESVNIPIQFELFAANGLTESPKPATFCGEDPTPNVNDSRLIRTGSGDNTMYEYTVTGFKPNKDYSFLLFRSSAQNLTNTFDSKGKIQEVSSYIDLREIVITPTANTNTNTDYSRSCSKRLHVINQRAMLTSDNGIAVEWHLTDPRVECPEPHKHTGMRPKVYHITLENMTTGEPSITFSRVYVHYNLYGRNELSYLINPNFVKSCSKYKVTIKGGYPNNEDIDKKDSYIITGTEPIRTLSSRRSCNIPLPQNSNVIASEQIKLTNGFHFKAEACNANLQNMYLGGNRTFHAFISPFCANHNNLRVSSIEYEDYIEEEFDDIVIDHIQIYPNPTSGELYVRVQEQGTIRILNMKGQEVYTSLVMPEVENYINLSSQANGVYFVNYISDTGESVIEKVVLY